MTIDIEALRNDLINYFGTASFYNPVAMMDVIEVESATDEKIIEIALKNSFDLTKYEIEETKKYR